MKHLIFLFALLIGISGTTLATDNKDNLTAEVVAQSGLTLRAEASKYSDILEVIPFAESVIILEEARHNAERINWVEGAWVKVDFEGTVGYVFDGFLSPLPTPLKEFELVGDDLDFTYAFESWMDYRFVQVQMSDTIIREDSHAKIIHYLENDQRMIQQDRPGYYMVEGVLSDVRIMDVYHLFLNMVPDKINRKYVSDQTVFLENPDQEVQEIKIQLDRQVKIKRLDNGQIKVRLYSPHYGCSL